MLMLVVLFDVAVTDDVAVAVVADVVVVVVDVVV